MREEIEQSLRAIEGEHGVSILYACESGSRAWGFASPDSDYDVRFIYRQPRDRYLSILDRKDVIELPVNAELDINGWDIRKALRLFLKSNGPLYEWLQSPIVYREETAFAEELRSLMHIYFSRRAGCHHYLSMARNVFENDLQGEAVRMKKYFYALRPALACLWMIEHKSVPPMEFGLLRAEVEDAGWQMLVDGLLEQKKGADEKAMIRPIRELQHWIGETLAASKEKADAIEPVNAEPGLLDALFRKYIGV